VYNRLCTDYHRKLWNDVVNILCDVDLCKNGSKTYSDTVTILSSGVTKTVVWYLLGFPSYGYYTENKILSKISNIINVYNTLMSKSN
jgi:hypothetical protein